DVAVPLTGGHRVVGWVVEAPDVDAVSGAHPGAQLAADALLHAVLVAVEDVPSVLARLLRLLLLRVLPGDPGPGEVLQGQLEPAEEAQLVLDVVDYAHGSTPS